MVHKINPLNPESDQHLISPYINMAEPYIKVMRTNSPCRYLSKCIEKSMENIDSDKGLKTFS